MGNARACSKSLPSTMWPLKFMKLLSCCVSFTGAWKLKVQKSKTTYLWMVEGIFLFVSSARTEANGEKCTKDFIDFPSTQEGIFIIWLSLALD
jgi:hypothetical protein